MPLAIYLGFELQLGVALTLSVILLVILSRCSSSSRPCCASKYTPDQRRFLLWDMRSSRKSAADFTDFTDIRPGLAPAAFRWLSSGLSARFLLRFDISPLTRYYSRHE